jgi:multiubiquitin
MTVTVWKRKHRKETHMETVQEIAGAGKGRDTDRTVTIIVNGREKHVPRNDDLTFDELIALAYDNPPKGEFIYWTITYRKGHGDKPEGTVIEGGSVKPKEGMVFNVTFTDKS